MSTIERHFRVLSASVADDYATWLRLWEMLPGRSVFAHPAYAGLWLPPGATALCAAFESPVGIVLFPFHLRKLPQEPWVPSGMEDAHDVITPYGYGGAFAAGDRRALAAEFWACLGEWYAVNRVVAEFVRLSLFADDILEYPGDVRELQLNVTRSLDVEEAELWNDYEYKVRKNVRRARSEGLAVVADTTGNRAAEFLAVYHETMDRRGARPEYYVSPEFLDQIRVRLAGHFVYFHVLHGESVVSTELVLHSDTAAYSFLGGTTAGAFSFRPNDLLKHTIILWAKAAGKRTFVLGGGATPHDGIFQYKKSFAPRGCVPFKIGTRVLMEDAYAGLLEARHAFLGRGPVQADLRAGFFPAYRA